MSQNSETINRHAFSTDDLAEAHIQNNFNYWNISSYSSLSKASKSMNLDTFHPEKIILSRQLPLNSENSNTHEGLTTTQRDKQRYWKINFIVVLLPLTLLLFPIHLLLFGKRGIKTTKEWLMEIFFRDHPLRLLLTYSFFIAALCLNAYFLYNGGFILYNLLYKGQVQDTIFEDMTNVFRTAPAVLPLNSIWIWGFSVRKLLLSFDRITYPEIDYQCGDGDSNHPSSSNDCDKEYVKTWKSCWTNMPRYRLRLLGVYLLVILNQGIHFSLIFQNHKSNDSNITTSSEIIVNNWIDFSLHTLYNLMLPCYIVVVWAIQFEFERLSLFIKSLIGLGVKPDHYYLAVIKKYFKQVTNHVMLVNDICNIYFSWVFIILYISVFNQAYGFSTVFVLIILRFWGINISIEDTAENQDAAAVRIFVGNLLGCIFQIIVVGLTIWFIICANGEARDLHIRINDFISQPFGAIKHEMYSSFRMLKNYMHSRMETELPALLSIWAVSLISLIPCCPTNNFIYAWMSDYRVIH